MALGDGLTRTTTDTRINGQQIKESKEGRRIVQITLLDLIGMHIGYGNGTFLSGFNYTLMFVDAATRYA